MVFGQSSQVSRPPAGQLCESQSQSQGVLVLCHIALALRVPVTEIETRIIAKILNLTTFHGPHLTRISPNTNTHLSVYHRHGAMCRGYFGLGRRLLHQPVAVAVWRRARSSRCSAASAWCARPMGRYASIAADRRAGAQVPALTRNLRIRAPVLNSTPRLLPRWRRTTRRGR